MPDLAPGTASRTATVTSNQAIPDVILQDESGVDILDELNEGIIVEFGNGRISTRSTTLSAGSGIRQVDI